MKRILFIEATASKGGIETFIFNICKYLNKSEYRATVLADCAECSIEKELNDINVKIQRIHPLKNGVVTYFKDLWRVINREKYDIVHINKNSLSDPLALLICRIKRIPMVVLHSHNTQPTVNSSSHILHKIFRNLILNKKIVRAACSEQAAQWMFGSSGYPYLLLQNGIEISRYSFNADVRNKVRIKLNISDNELAVCNVGRLCNQKNSLFIIDIINSMVKINSEARLFLIGSGELENEVKEKVRQLKLERSVIFLGNRSDVNQLLQGMDLFLMPSLYEGLPIAAVEAQAASLPLLISDTVDKGVKLLNSTEFERLDASADIWAEHCMRLVNGFRRRNAEYEMKKSGYDIVNSARELERLYSSRGNTK